MTAPTPSAPPVSDDQLIRLGTYLSVAFAVPLLMVLALGMFVLVPDAAVHSRGLVIGAALGLVSWFGSRWITSHTLPRSAVSGPGGVHGAARIVAFRGIAVADLPALLALVLVLAIGDVGPLVVAVPIAIVAIVVNASGPGAIRRHLDRLRA